MFKVAVVTGTRAEYGLLRPVLKKLVAEPDLSVTVLVTGAHLSAEHGSTVREIEADGFPIAAKFDILSAHVPQGRSGTAFRTEFALRSFIEYFSRDEFRPDVLLALGDRYEMLAAGEAAALLEIPVAHISGGDVTSGADDDWFRHCITKMAKLHFPSCEAYRQRVIRMGEEPGRVFNVGGLGDENIRHTQFLTRQELAQELRLDLAGAFALVTFHPETATGLSAETQSEMLVRAMDQNQGLFYLITKANADTGGEIINARMEAFCRAHNNAALFASLGTQKYLSAMKWADLVLGNSSSGVVETPSLGTPTVDIGRRQAGRMTGENVIHCEMETKEILAAVQKALSPMFKERAKKAESPYNGGDTSGKIVFILREFLHSGKLAGPKIFYDGEERA